MSDTDKLVMVTMELAQNTIEKQQDRIAALEAENEELKKYLAIEVGPEMWHLEEIDKAKVAGKRESAEEIREWLTSDVDGESLFGKDSPYDKEYCAKYLTKEGV